MKLSEEEYRALLSNRRYQRLAIDEHKAAQIVESPRKKRGTEPIRPARVTRLEIVLPIQLISEANTASSEHWAKRHKRNKKQQAEIAEYWSKLLGDTKIVPPVTIRITRIGKRKLDSDNLPTSAKHIRDQIALIIGLDDGSELLTWEYSQVIGAKEYGVKVEFICQ